MKNKSEIVKEKNTRKNVKWMLLLVAGAYLLLVLACLLKPVDEYSVSERRKLALQPAFSWNSVVSGKYMEEIEEYMVDQFVFRDAFRSLKALFATGIMQKKDVNDIYMKNGYLSKMEYPMNADSVMRANAVFRGIYDKYLSGTSVNSYFSIIPDKNKYLADNGGKEYLSMDYEEFLDIAYSDADFLKSIRIEESLCLEDFYKTDTHWKQENITDTAKIIAGVMGVELTENYEIKETKTPFYGVYYGQAALPIEADRIKYCTNTMIEEFEVYDLENSIQIPVYDLKKVTDRDPYEMFLGGNISLAEIYNQNALSQKELVVFGDSFSRSMVPLLAQGYRKTTLIDIRYLPSAYIGKYVSFESQDVLFLYSTSVLNNSITLK